MKVFGGGDLLDASLSPAGKALTANQCLHYALTRPAVASVLVGAHTACLLYTSAFTAGITAVNSLPAHYLCPNCKYVDFDSDYVKSFSGRSRCV